MAEVITRGRGRPKLEGGAMSNAERQRKYREKNKDKYASYKREWYLAHKDSEEFKQRRREASRRYYQKNKAAQLAVK